MIRGLDFKFGRQCLGPIPEVLRIVAKGGYIPGAGSYNSGFTRSERRSRVLTGGQPVKSIRFVFANIYLTQGEKNGPYAMTVEAGLERIVGGSQTVMATFAGQPTVTIAPGGYAVTDPIYPSAFGLSEFPANYDMRCRTGLTVSSGQNWVYFGGEQFETISGQSNALSNSASSQISGTGAITTPVGGSSNGISEIAAYGPTAIIGEWSGTPDVSLMISGDSIVSRTNDVQDNGTIGGGFISNGIRSVSGRCIPSVKVAIGGEQASHWGGGNTFRKYLMGFCTHYIDNFGTNDLANSKTAAQTLTAKQTIWSDFKSRAVGAKYIINVPVIPLTTTTDSWATLANQTASSQYVIGGARDTLNSSVAALVGMSNGPNQIFDANLYWQSTTATDKFIVNGAANYPTSDGIHPQPALHNLAAAGLATAAAGWTTT